MRVEKPDKKSLQYLGIIIVIAVLVCFGYFYYLKKTEIKEVLEQEPFEKTMEEILESLSAPPGGAEPISDETREDLSAPSESEVSEDVLKNLTVPE